VRQGQYEQKESPAPCSDAGLKCWKIHRYQAATIK
jgi:hypothetical protein